MVQSDTKQSQEFNEENQKVDMRKFKKRLTTTEEIQEIHDNRKKYKEEDLRAKMQRISDQLRECGKL